MSECIAKDFFDFELEEAHDGTQKGKLVHLLHGKSLDTMEDVEYVADYLLKNGVSVE